MKSTFIDFIDGLESLLLDEELFSSPQETKLNKNTKTNRILIILILNQDNK